MNKKSKSKNKPSKPQNPLPPQDTQKSVEPEKNIIEEITAVEAKVDERVPEILADPVVIEAADDDFESPKKPKRNRAKKKRETQEVTDNVKTSTLIEETKIEMEVAEEKIINRSEPDNLAPIEPASRKKKGKREQPLRIPKEVTETKEEPNKLEVAHVVEPQATELQEHESKSKKKNKKSKKRTDSERSDKCEETLLCTAAFQKILQPKPEIDQNKDTKKADTGTIDMKISAEISKKESEVAVKKDVKGDHDKVTAPEKTKKGKPENLNQSGTGPRETDKKCSNVNKDPKSESKEIPLKDQIPPIEQCKEMLKATSSESVIVTQDEKCTFEDKNNEKSINIKNKEKNKKKDQVIKSESTEIKKHDVEKLEPLDANKAKPITIESPTVAPNIESKPVKDIISKSTECLKTENVAEAESLNKKDELMCKKKNEKVKKSKELPREEINKVPIIGTDFEPVKLTDILKIADTKVDKVINKEEKQLLPKTDILTIQEKDISSVVDTLCQETNIFATEKDNKDITSKNQEEINDENETKDHKNMGARPKAKIAKPVEKNKGKHKNEATMETDIIKESIVNVLESQKTVVEDSTKESLNLSPIICHSEGKSNKNIAAPIPLQDCTKMESVKSDLADTVLTDAAKKQACEILMEMIEKVIPSEAKETLSKQQEMLQSPQEKTKKKKSPKPQRKSTPTETTTKNNEGNTSKGTKNIEKPSEAHTTKEKSPIKEIIKESSLPVENLTDTDEELMSIEKKMITPDQIEYPRSASVQYNDNNNNMLIQEINEPLVISAIHEQSTFACTVETPQEAPKTVLESVKLATIIDEPEDLVKIEPIPTDLKSKVLEVNRDMEGLRLSIERSLAELSALEKSEEAIFKPITTTSAIQEAKSQISGDKEKSKIIPTDVKATEVFTTPSPTALVEIVSPNITQIEDVVVPKPIKIGDPFIETPPKVDIASEEIANPPTPPQRKENKGKNKSKKKGKQETTTQTASQSNQTTSSASETQKSSESTQKDDGKQTNPNDNKSQEEKQCDSMENKKSDYKGSKTGQDNIEPDTNTYNIENFEDALTTSIDDVSKAFEDIADEVAQQNIDELAKQTAETNLSEPDETKKSEEERKEKENPVSQPKNFLGHPYNPVPSNKTDYKKEKNKPPNEIAAKIKIKDSVEIEPKNNKISKESQTLGKPKIKNKNPNEVLSVTNDNEEYVYKYSFRNVFLNNVCQVCKKDVKVGRVVCNFCYLISYCSQKHKEEDYVQHQSLCFAVSTLSHLKGQKFIYADATNLSGYNYRLLRMQTIISCEKILKRKLQPWEQEALLYPRMCVDAGCREWREDKLKDCEQCGQQSYCSSNPAHLPKIHQRWCASYRLYHKLVVHQLTEGRLDPRMPSKVLNCANLTDNFNRILADMYEEKIDMTDIEYASLTQLATAPLTAAYSYQLYRNKITQFYPDLDLKKPTFTVHVIGAELQFEADSLHKWETFFLHVKPEVQTLRVVLVGSELNPGNLPLQMLGKVKLCANCRVEKKRLEFDFQDNKHYCDYFDSNEFVKPDIVCAFNPSIQRASSYTKDDQWMQTLKCVLKQNAPFLVTSYTMTEMQRDMNAIKTLVKDKINVISEARFNPFASVRPDRNFISDDEMPLLFKNYCYMVIIRAF